MRVAVPTSNGVLSAHFGHCEEFTFVDVDESNRTIKSVNRVSSPPHQPGMLPTWLAERGATMILAGGIGQRAIQLFQAANITVMTGVPQQTPEQLVTSYLEGSIQTSDNTCDNAGHQDHNHDHECRRK